MMRKYIVSNCIVVPHHSVTDTMEKLRGKIKEKDLEQLAATKKIEIPYLIAYDRDFKDFDEYIKPKNFLIQSREKPQETEF